MMIKTDRYQNFLADIHATCVVITPNERLAAMLQRDYQALQATTAQRVWESPSILSMQNYVKKIWREHYQRCLQAAPYLLNSAQENAIWENLISNSVYSQHLLQAKETARAIRNTYALLKAWQVPVEAAIFQTANDYIALQSWVKTYEQYLAAHHYIDEAGLIEDFLQQAADCHERPAKILAYGFTEFTPQQQRLFNYFRAAGTEIIRYDMLNHNQHCVQIGLADKEAELFSMARWAKQLLSEQSTARIACVIPSLSKQRDRIQQIFTEVFQPTQDDPSQSEKFFNISAGRQLTHFALIQTGLHILHLLQRTSLSLQDLDKLLLTPFIILAEKEAMQRSQYLRFLNQQNILSCCMTQLLDTNHAPQFQQYCPALHEALHKLVAVQSRLPASAPYQTWVKIFIDCLAILGWPGERSLASDEYQLVSKWLECFHQLKTFDYLQSNVSLHTALETLQQITAETIFQAKTPEAPIQVLGLLEAASQPFDYMWIAEMDDVSWPPQPKPNPFIPKRLQRDLNMPHATAQRELQFCQSLMQQLINLTKTVILSYAEQVDGIELQASPLIRNIPAIELLTLNLDYYARPAEMIFAAQAHDLIADYQAPALTPEETIRGGASLIKQQGQCPFKAFAELRLGARAIETPVLGLRAKDRGNILHKAMEQLWKTLPDQQALLALDQASEAALIEKSITFALTAVKHQREQHPAYLQLEKKRLTHIIQAWLALEKQRPQFRVAALEKEVSVYIESLMLSMRIDRIDELEDGSHLVIDYKTSKSCDMNKWFGERPEEPQLPLYALFDTEKTLGISFAQVIAGAPSFKGLSCDEIEIKGIKPIAELRTQDDKINWSQQIQSWHMTFNNLAQDFAQGKATVDPKTAQTCVWCDLKPFCRIFEKGTMIA